MGSGTSLKGSSELRSLLQWDAEHARNARSKLAGAMCLSPYARWSTMVHPFLLGVAESDEMARVPAS
jgi:hypothetical protein